MYDILHNVSTREMREDYLIRKPCLKAKMVSDDNLEGSAAIANQAMKRSVSWTFNKLLKLK
jgi:hypothetical protein